MSFLMALFFSEHLPFIIKQIDIKVVLTVFFRNLRYIIILWPLDTKN